MTIARIPDIVHIRAKYAAIEKPHIYRYNRCIMEKLLSQLLPSFAHKALAADGISPVETVDIMNIPITNLAFDSRDVKEGSLFFALPGTHQNGNDFISEALEAGANAVV